MLFRDLFVCLQELFDVDDLGTLFLDNIDGLIFGFELNVFEGGVVSFEGGVVSFEDGPGDVTNVDWGVGKGVLPVS